MTKKERPNKNKIRTNITIDKDLYELLHKKENNISALITSLLWKFYALEKSSQSQVSNLETHNSEMWEKGLEPSNLKEPILSRSRLTTSLLPQYK